MLTLISPKLNTKLRYRAIFKKSINLSEPHDINEKNLWLKLNNYMYNQLVKQCADKYTVRNYILSKGCEEILNELLAVYSSADDFNWDILPKIFVIKYNIGSGNNIICTDKSKINKTKINKEMKNWFKKKPYLPYSEMQYKGVSPVILVEKFLDDQHNELPIDYKFYCRNGRAEYVMLCIGRENNGKPKLYWYDRNWKFLPFDEKINPNIDNPILMDKVFKYADIL